MNNDDPLPQISPVENYIPPQPNIPIEPTPPTESNKKIWLLITIPILVVIIGMTIFLFMNFSIKTISVNEFSQGINFELKENKEVKFILNDTKHTIKVNSVSKDSVNLIIQSNPIQIDIKIGEEKKLDLDNDGIYDLKIKLKSIKSNVPSIYIKEINETICTENWNCEEWDSCSEEGKQTRTCTDLNNCEIMKGKPETEQKCEFVCVEDWNCNDWNSCVNEVQTRTCADLNNCGTEENKPSEEQSCTLQILDCGNNALSQETQGNQPNFDCFIEASENCKHSKLSNTLAMEIFGMLSIVTTYMELKGMDSGKCIYYQRIENNSVEFTDEMVQTMLNGGTTQEEINQQEQIANEAVRETIGLEQTCKFNNDELTSMLNRWKGGSFDGDASCTLNSDGTSNCTYTGDFENANCVSSP